MQDQCLLPPRRIERVQAAGEATVAPSRTVRTAVIELVLLLGALQWVLWTESKHLMLQPYRSMGSAGLVGVVVWLLIRQRVTWHALGLAPRSWSSGLGWLIAATAGGIAGVTLAGLHLGTVGQVERFWHWVGRIWHLEAAQQVLLQVLLVPRLAIVLGRRGGLRACPETGTGSPTLQEQRSLGRRCRVPVPVSGQTLTSLAAAIIFGALHAPNLPLMLLCSLPAFVWCEWFRRHRNLPAVWLSHLLLGAASLYCLAPFLGRLRVGIGYLYLP